LTTNTLMSTTTPEPPTGQQTFADQIKLAAKARRYTKKQLVSELLESDCIIRADARKIRDLGDQVMALLKLVADIRSAVGDPHGKLMQTELLEKIRNLGLGKTQTQ